MTLSNTCRETNDLRAQFGDAFSRTQAIFDAVVATSTKVASHVRSRWIGSILYKSCPHRFRSRAAVCGFIFLICSVTLSLSMQLFYASYHERRKCTQLISGPVPTWKHDPVEVHVAYAVDPFSFPGLLNSMLSATWHLQFPELCTFHIFVQAQHVMQLGRILDCFHGRLVALPARPRVKVHTLALDAGTDVFVSDIKNLSRPDLGLVENNVRLFLADYLPNLSRVIWLDADTIVRHDLINLYGALANGVIAAAPSGYEWVHQFHMNKLQSYNKSAPVFNAGVMVLNLDKWRAENMTLAVMRWMGRAQTEGFNRGGFNQGPLNLALKGLWDAVDARWNVWVTKKYRCKSGSAYISGAFILHFAGPHPKPWEPDQTSPYSTGAEYARFDYSSCAAVSSTS